MRKIEELSLLETINSNVLVLFDLLGLKLQDCGGYFRGSCPIHGGDNTGAFVYYKDTNRWICFSHACQSPRSAADPIDLCAKIWNISRHETVDRLKLTFNTGETDISGIVFKNAIKTRKYERRDMNPMPENSLDMFNGSNDFYVNRGYLPSTLSYFDIRYCDRIGTRFWNRMIIPIHNTNGELVGWSGRWCGDYKKDHVEKFLHTADLQKTRLLYNWHRAEKYFSSKQIVIVESPGAVWGLHQIGVYNAVAVLGCAISNEQARIITSCQKINNVVIAFDPDKAGSEAMTERSMSIRNLKHKIGIQVMNLTQGMDLDNISLEDFKYAFANRKRV